MKRRLISIVLSLTLVICGITTLSVSVSASSENYVHPIWTRCRAGETVDIGIGMDIWDGVSCMVFSPEYDHSVMTLKNITCNIDYGTFMWNEDTENPKFLWYNHEDYSFSYGNNQPSFTMTFEISADAADGMYNINLNYDQNNICNDQCELVSLNVSEGSVEIFRFIKGDVNDDLSIDAADLVLLSRYILGLEAEVQEGADVNQDGMIDGRDVVKLARHMVGYEMIY